MGETATQTSRISELTSRLIEEEEEMWRQMRRKREFEISVENTRERLTGLQELRRHTGRKLAESLSTRDFMSSKVDFARDQEESSKHALSVAKESNRVLAARLNVSPDDESKEDGQQELSAKDQQLGRLRAHVEYLLAERLVLQQRRQVLYEQHRAAEQDRNSLLNSLQEDRSCINELRLARIKNLEQRHSAARAVTALMRDGCIVGRVQGGSHSAPLAQPSGRRDVLVENFVSGPDNSEFSSMPVLPPPPQWTTFDNPSEDASGVTEWAGRLQEFKSHAVEQRVH